MQSDFFLRIITIKVHIILPPTNLDFFRQKLYTKFVSIYGGKMKEGSR